MLIAYRSTEKEELGARKHKRLDPTPSTMNNLKNKHLIQFADNTFYQRHWAESTKETFHPIDIKYLNKYLIQFADKTLCVESRFTEQEGYSDL